MPQANANGVTIEYEIEGSGPPLVLIMGLGGQLTDWPTTLVDHLSSHFSVIRFDNRDAGLSTEIDAPAPSTFDIARSAFRRSSDRAAYDLSDMAADTAALMDALEIEAAHIVGMSMGGMIAQQLTIDAPQKVKSLCSIMSNTGNRFSGQPTPRVWAALARRRELPTENVLEAALDFFELIGGPDFDREAQRERTAASLQRSFRPDAVLRQSLAIAASPERTDGLRKVDAPTLVVHGLADSLVRYSGGVATSRAVPGSRLLLFPRMGHDLPAGRLDEISSAIVSNSRRSA